MGYQFLARLSLAAVVSLGARAGAVAGAIEGAVTFPSQFVPSMTVYASETRLRGTAVVTQYYVWNQRNAALVQSGEYQQPSQTFCASGAPSPIMR